MKNNSNNTYFVACVRQQKEQKQPTWIWRAFKAPKKSRSIRKSVRDLESTLRLPGWRSELALDFIRCRICARNEAGRWPLYLISAYGRLAVKEKCSVRKASRLWEASLTVYGRSPREIIQDQMTNNTVNGNGHTTSGNDLLNQMIKILARGKTISRKKGPA